MDAITVKDLSYQIGDRPILERISIAIPANTFVVIFGPNGAGKTTFLKLLTGNLAPSAGQIMVHGEKPSRARTCFGYVPQHLLKQSRFPLSVLQMVTMGRFGRLGFFRRPSSQDVERARHCLEEVGLNGLEDRPLSALSGGELQRACIARALAGDPKILLLDEASSAIDVGGRESLFALLARLKKDLTVILVTHDMSAVSKEVDLVLCLNKTLVSHGRPEEALTQEALACMYGGEAHFFSHCHAPHVHAESHKGS